jgi:NifB/MoaA-like Fe-S oxidoreductase
VNDGAVLTQTLDDLWAFGPAILSCSVVPVGLTEFSKHHLCREPTRDECRAAVREVESRWTVALAQRETHWVYGADELYLRAGLELPAAATYDGFEQVENGVGSVRWLQQRIAAEAPALRGWQGRRIGVVTGTAMAPLMPQVLELLARATGGRFALIPVENSLFGPSVTTAGLLPGAAIERALARRTDLELVLLPGECVNDDGLFIDSVDAHALAARLPFEIRFSKDFADALAAPLAA